MHTQDERQQALLKVLLKHKEGLPLDDLALQMGITRPVIRKPLAALITSGFIERGDKVVTGGRPVQTYRLTGKGYELFPKQYTWFSEVLLENLKSQLGSAGVRDLMEKLGADVGRQFSEKLQGKSLKEKVEETVKLMNELAYQAEHVLTGRELVGDPPVVEARNCVFHTLALKYPEICQFDLSLLNTLTGALVSHEKCILRKDHICRFRFRSKDD